MNATESKARYAAASKRILDVSPETMIGLSVALFGAMFFRAAVHLCIGFGTASLVHISAWWGLPVALLSAQTIGRAWLWWRREAVILAIEKAADDAEKRAGVKS